MRLLLLALVLALVTLARAELASSYPWPKVTTGKADIASRIAAPKGFTRTTVAIGDVFIRGGSPGHAVIVLDMAENKATGERVFLLAQGYMPAQDIHILKNPSAPNLSPWYSTRFGTTLQTPEWEFKAGELKAFKSPT